MARRSNSGSVVKFDRFSLDLSSGELRTATSTLVLPEQPFLLLRTLLERPGEVVTREELRQRLWQADTFVDYEHGLNAAIKRLREALHDSGSASRLIETIPRRGYRFTGQVEEAPDRSERRNWTTPSAASRLIPGLMILFVVLLLGWSGWTQWARTSPSIDSLAVMPFANLTGSSEHAHFVDAMHDAVIAELAQIRRLTVISRQSVLRYRETNKSIPAIARELDVDAVVEGSVFRAGDSVRTTIQVVQGRPTERHLWVGTFQGNMSGILALQAEVARGIARRVDAAVSPEELGRLGRDRPNNPAAYDAWLRGWIEENRGTPGGLQQCIAHAAQAVALDVDYGPAYVLAAKCHISSYWFRQAPPEAAFPSAKKAAQRAIAVDGSLGNAHALLGFALAAYDWDWSGAERAFTRALDIAPGDPDTHRYYSFFLNWMGRHQEALEFAARAERLSPGPNPFMTAALVFARRYDDAIAHALHDVELFPDYGFGYEWLALAYDAGGRYQESLRAQQQAIRLMGPGVARKAILGRAYARAAQHGAALQILADLRDLERTSYVAPAQFSYVLIGLGKADEAIDYLERGYGARDAEMAFLNTYPVFDPLRGHPRFQDLLRRMKFPAATAGPAQRDATQDDRQRR